MKRYHHPVTPAEVSSAISSLCSDIVPGVTPFFVEVRPKQNEDANECFHVVRRHAAALGGEAVIGWSIWELPSVFVEAEFHSVWHSPEGEHIDLTRKNDATAKILFLPDPHRSYEGRPINNFRKALSGEPVVREWFEALDAKYELMNRGGRAFEHGEIHLEGREAAEYNAIEEAIEELGLQVLELHPYVGPYLPCLCGSGKKAKWCHGAK